MKYLRAVGFFFGTLGIYLVPPLLGWGIGDLRGFFSLYPRLGYAVLVAVLGLAVVYQAIDAPEGIRGGRGKAGKLVSRQSIVKIVVILLMYGALVFLPFADRRGIGVMFESQALRWPGLILVGLGFAWIFWSGFALGRLYSADVTIQKDHRLITTGPYRYIRHPRYLGALLIAVGLPILFRSWIGLMASVLFLGVLLFRIKDEEVLLHREFGPEWEAYCGRSWRLIPYLYLRVTTFAPVSVDVLSKNKNLKVLQWGGMPQTDIIGGGLWNCFLNLGSDGSTGGFSSLSSF